MIHWAWIPIALVIGVVCGILLVALMETARDDDRPKRWWDDG